MYIYSAIKDRWGRLSQTGNHIFIGFELFNDWNLVDGKCFQSLNKSFTQKQLYFQGSRLARIYSHTQQHCLPVLKSLTWAQVRYKYAPRWLSLICPHNFPPLMYDWYTLHCCVTCPIIRYVIDGQVCHSLHSSFSCKNLSCVVSLLVLARGIIRNGATLINILYKY